MDSHAILGRILDAHRKEQGALLPVLHEVQDALGHIPPDAWFRRSPRR
jgi:formate dehydrogenase subunit gamma